MGQPRFTEDFKIDAVKQITERGYAVGDVSQRLGVSTHSLYAWLKKYAASPVRVARELTDLIVQRGKPGMIVSDNVLRAEGNGEDSPSLSVRQHALAA